MKTVTHLSLPPTVQRLDARTQATMSRAEIAHLVRLGCVVSAVTVILAAAARLVLDLPAGVIVVSAFAVALAAGMIDSSRQQARAEHRPRRIRVRVSPR